VRSGGRAVIKNEAPSRFCAMLRCDVCTSDVDTRLPGPVIVGPSVKAGIGKVVAAGDRWRRFMKLV
jgi:hypothetical protein